MDIQRFWRDALDLWGTLDQHPLLHAALGLAVLLLVSLLIGRLARFLILHASRLLGRQPALTGWTTCATTRCSTAWPR
jgi:miniconductance mechanosensitive channel